MQIFMTIVHQLQIISMTYNCKRKRIGSNDVTEQIRDKSQHTVNLMLLKMGLARNMSSISVYLFA